MLPENLKTLRKIEEKYYFPPIKKNLEEKMLEVGPKHVLNYLSDIMINSKDYVEELIEDRIETGKIYDPNQTRKVVGGNGFQSLVAYSLIKLQENDVINPELVITLKPRSHYLINDYATIIVGDEVQKPDLDLLIYNPNFVTDFPILIYSIKTSLRERAGQTYRWKLLMDIATTQDCQTIKNKYDLIYNANSNFKIGFITSDFYNEIYNPQQQGMLKFFDFVYLTKDTRENNIVNKMSHIIEDLNNLYKK